MPAVQAPAHILVTGASGYIAAHCVKELIDRGFSVRGTVRSDSKGKYLKKQFGDKFEYVIVEDIEKPDAFNDAIQGIDGILHTASPFHFNVDDPQELIGPAVAGTLGILKAAPDTVKRIVITSSVASVVEPVPDSVPQRIFTEADWNRESPKIVEKEGKGATALHKYRASKVLAEEAAWNYTKKEKKPWDIATICPPLVYGPVIHDVSSPESLNTSAKGFYDNLYKGKLPESNLVSGAASWVDVRDVARAHVQALSVDAAGGRRFIVTTGPFIWQHWLDAADEAGVSIPIKANPEGAKGWKPSAIFKNDAAREVLKMQFRTIPQTLKDSFADFKSRGW